MKTDGATHEAGEGERAWYGMEFGPHCAADKDHALRFRGECLRLQRRAHDLQIVEETALFHHLQHAF